LLDDDSYLIVGSIRLDIIGKVGVGVGVGEVQENLRCNHEFDFLKDLLLVGCPALTELLVAKAG
jgi:hypothetical protein